MDKFWMCYNANKYPHNIPTKRHHSLEAVKVEAERICRKEGGQEVAILECIGSVKFKETPIEFVESTLLIEGCLKNEDNL